jgi:hypothetical protein
MRHRLIVCLLLCLVALGACAAPASHPAPAQPAATDTRPGVVKVDRSCRRDADCAVKDVGNCCGAAPACVNVDSPTDPQGVAAQCRASGRMSICGFRQITSCQCVAGQCADSGAAPDTLPRPAASS